MRLTLPDCARRNGHSCQNVFQQHPLGIRYVPGDAMCMDWWDGTAYDGVVCNMTLMASTTSTRRCARWRACCDHPDGSTCPCCTPASRATRASTPCQTGLPTADTRPRDGGPPGRSAARSCRCSPPHAVDLPERRAVFRAPVRVIHRGGRRPSPRAHHSRAPAALRHASSVDDPYTGNVNRRMSDPVWLERMAYVQSVDPFAKDAE